MFPLDFADCDHRNPSAFVHHMLRIKARSELYLRFIHSFDNSGTENQDFRPKKLVSRVPRVPKIFKFPVEQLF